MNDLDQDSILINKIQELESTIDKKNLEIKNLSKFNNKIRWVQKSISNNWQAIIPISVVCFIILTIFWLGAGFDTNNFYMNWNSNPQFRRLYIYQEVDWGLDRSIGSCAELGASTIEDCSDVVLNYEKSFNKLVEEQNYK